MDITRLIQAIHDLYQKVFVRLSYREYGLNSTKRTLTFQAKPKAIVCRLCFLYLFSIFHIVLQISTLDAFDKETWEKNQKLKRKLQV